MRSDQKKILNTLKKKPLTRLELALSTNYAITGISTRIAELKKLGYNIESRPVEVNKYFIIDCPNDSNEKETVLELEKHKDIEINDKTSKKIIDWLETKNRFNSKVDLNTIANEINEPLDEIKLTISKMFSKYRILQMSNTSVIVYR